jgi:hypothetical protein
VKVFLFALALTGIAASAMSRPAQAAMGGGCGTLCMNSLMSPYVGLPFFPMPSGYGSYYQTGQMSPMVMNDPRYLMAASINWNGAQPMGTSYMPAVGLTAIQNSLVSPAWF